MTTLPPGSIVGANPILWLHEGWRLARTTAGALKDPSQLAGLAAKWHDAVVPGTVAASIHKDINLPGDYDADDWWYRLEIPEQNPGQTRVSDENPGLSRVLSSRVFLRFDGLATLADVWLNGEKILSSSNMFLAHRVDVTGKLRERNELVIAFRSLGEALKERRARPRWKTQLVANQNLRAFRTTLLGRIPGWTPAITPVGPWGAIGIETVDAIDIRDLRIHATRKRLELHARIDALAHGTIDAARVLVGDRSHDVLVEANRIRADIAIDAPSWWPHTHGTPHLEACLLELRCNGEWVRVDCGRVGFRDIGVDTSGDGVRFTVNGVPVFCRGACWTTLDILRLRGDAAALRRALETARDAGVNMLRIGGTMTYESDDFYRLCDELGILVWQDFMFANMDFPVDDAGFRASIEAEAAQQLERLHRHPCIAAYCGGSEVAQQAAMMGLPRKYWSNDFFLETLPRLCAEIHPGSAYFPSSPWGGALPFHASSGIAHYYGVGAYRRPLADARAANVKFATECLGFSNVPEAETMAQVLDGTLPPPHHPRWKARVPRDGGSGYDFEDVRDHYLESLFGERAAELRAQDVARYYALSRVVSGELMARTYAEWRRPGSGCGGALVWFWRDIWPGAGWGLTDSNGNSKAALWYLRRAWTPLSIHLTDEGLDGHHVHAINETPEPLEAIVEIEMYKDGRATGVTAQSNVSLAARGAVSLQVDAMLGYFSDSTNAYRFGPAKFDVVAARLIDAVTGETRSADFVFPAGMGLRAQRDVKVDARAERLADGRVEVVLRSESFLQAVSIACDGFTPDDNYFHLAPGEEKRVRFTPSAEGRAFKAQLEALNWNDTVVVRI